MYLWKFYKKGKQAFSVFAPLLISRFLGSGELTREDFHALLVILLCEQYYKVVRGC